MTRPTILAIIEDGPRAGETVHLDAEGEDHPPKEFLLPDEHLGARPADRRTPPSGSVSIYRLVGRDEERGGYVYKWNADTDRVYCSRGAADQST